MQVKSPNYVTRWLGLNLCSATYCVTLGKLQNLSRLSPQQRSDNSGNLYLLGLL